MNPSRHRIEAVDAARGVALAAMGVYHFVWDLSFYNFVSPSTFYDPRFQFFGHIIAVSFLGLVGVSLALAAQGGFNAGAYARRTALVAGAAALVSLCTYLFIPDAFIAFGILHCIAAASVIALAFLRARSFVALGAGVLIVLAPWLFSSPTFDSAHWFLGLGVTEPRTLDWRPLFPWSGFTLIGLGIAQVILLRGAPERIAQWRASGGLARSLSFGGRHSLAVYVLHQPLLLAIVFVAATASANFWSVGASSATQEADFRLSCSLECTAAGPARDFCEKACDCVVRDSKNVGLWRQVIGNSLTREDRHRFDALTRACLAPDAEMIR